MAEKVTAGRDTFGDFAPKYAELNDDVLFGQVWSREAQLSARDRSVVTVTAIMASGVLTPALQGHIERAKANGVTGEEMAEVLTHAAFYAGWPKAWAALSMAQEVYAG
ncbi:carboxymuconolactone decarboxylase family protein [Rothia sp. AR01]|uniref:Carboxymuconolactone decarboxylase family protein n=1 Tax=Rothia santali TaxID=2949643 RepID=A0A9X2HF98_9MICC|nr:carboxymuconolactone decarboxylase family protein [Rothia santali]MCP3425702.1 carboxymuconolactone decarboxylase family protein [Rothia santali]